MSASSATMQPVQVRVLTSKDEEAVALVCVETSLKALATSGRVQARALDVTDLCDEGVLADADVLLITGGEPRRLRGLIGGGGATAIRTFVREGGGYVGVCAGAVLATRKAPTLELLPTVRCVDDNVWWASGLCGRVSLRQPESAGHSPEVDVLSACFGDVGVYESGPLLAFDQPKQRRKKPSRRERESMADGSDGEDDEAVLATEPLALFDSDVRPWRPDRSASRLPSRGDMSGTVAALSSRHGSGRVVLSSIHPELSGRKSDKLLLENMCLFAAGSPSLGGAPVRPAPSPRGKRPCLRCGHRTSKRSCKRCGADLAAAAEKESSSEESQAS